MYTTLSTGMTLDTAAQAFQQVTDQVYTYFTDPQMWTKLILTIIQVVVIFIAGRVVVKLAKRGVEHMMVEREHSALKFDGRRTRTIWKLAGNIISYTVNFLMILLIFNQLGFHLGPLLAGAGVVGLAIGFGAQNLVKDVITGFFIIFEDQFGVGDTIQIGNNKGTVEEIGLRITRIRSWTGEVFIIPNGTITEVTNFSLYNSIAVVDISISYEADIDAAINVIGDTSLRIYKDDENIVKDPEVLGVQKLGNSEVVIRVTAECKPNTHFAVSRKMNAEIKKALDQAGIEIPYPRVVTIHRTEHES
ncbi:MAG: mechanosensitive ion channel protein MscS [Paenibacillus sp. RIFOXYA1_FULL_44_5]|nr:MAG: mechanosensitive ion channel protein MscS [Paenibacillus sp. RIFOXYA1_FULL_44_5]